MFGLALYLLLSYIMYNVAMGFVLALVYYIKERDIHNEDFWWLLFPAVGLGRWIYYRHIRHGLTPQYPAKWYVYKYMIWLHGLYIPLFMYSCYALISQPDTELSTYATEATGNAGGGQLVGLGLIIDVIVTAFEGLYHFLGLLVKIAIAAILSLCFVVLPLHAKGTIETQYRYNEPSNTQKERTFKSFKL